MPTGERTDPFRTYNFIVEIGGDDKAGFSECTGLSAEGDIVEYREGNEDPWPRKLVGLRKTTNVTLKRGYTQKRDLWDWYLSIPQKGTDRRDVTIKLCDETGKPVMSWQLLNAWINKIDGPSFNATGNEVAIESLEIVHERLILEQTSG